MPSTLKCDVAVVGGGLAGSLIALALAARRPDVSVGVIEAGERIGGNHLWSFFDADVDAAHRWLVTPLVGHAWSGYDVAFPAHAQGFGTAYFSVESERLDAAVRAAIPAERLLLGHRVLACSPTAVVLDDGGRVEAGAVIDARGAGDLSRLRLGWQKFVGREIEVPGGHGLTRPVVMDATVPQLDGYRFVYLLPFSDTRVFVEDTYYSDTPDLDDAALSRRIDAYVDARGWRTGEPSRNEPLREERGVLPVVIGGDFEGYWRAGGAKLAKAGARAGLFHPTTGYSLPDAVRLAIAIADAPDLSAEALHALTHGAARRAWRARGFYRMLDAMLFGAALPGQRYRVLERFYRLPPPLIRRFYAARSTTLDKARILTGRPPVPIGRAIGALRNNR